MVKLNVGNVLLKPSHRRQLMTWLKRAQKLGAQIGNFFLTLTLHRSGRQTEVHAHVSTASGSFALRNRSNDWRDALREIAKTLSLQLASLRWAH